MIATRQPVPPNFPAGHPRGVPPPGLMPGRAERPVAEWKLIVFLLAHAPAAVVMKLMPVLGTAHALGTLLVGLALCLAGRRFDRVAAWGAYVAGAEVIWRMTRADVFWEYGKYAHTISDSGPDNPPLRYRREVYQSSLLNVGIAEGSSAMK